MAATAALAATLRPSGEDGAVPAPRSNSPTVIDRGALAVTLPTGWRQLGVVPHPAGMRLAQPVAIADPGAGLRLVAGFTTAESETLLTRRFVEGVGTTLPRARPVSTDSGLQGVHYFGLSPRGAESLLDVYVAPTTEGILTVACIAKSVGSLLDDCFTGVSAIRLRRGRPLPAGRDAAVRDALRARVHELESADAVARRRLAAAPTARDQVRALQGLRAKYEAAAHGLATLAPRSVKWPQHALRALGRTSAAYAALERSIDAGAGYRRARARVVEQRAELRQLLGRVLSPPG